MFFVSSGGSCSFLLGVVFIIVLAQSYIWGILFITFNTCFFLIIVLNWFLFERCADAFFNIILVRETDCWKAKVTMGRKRKSWIFDGRERMTNRIAINKSSAANTTGLNPQSCRLMYPFNLNADVFFDEEQSSNLSLVCPYRHQISKPCSRGSEYFLEDLYNNIYWKGA